MKLVVFPNDPIRAYYEKGEIKARYFNPKNLFDEVHVICPTDSEIEEGKVRVVAGDASLKFYPIGKLNLINYRSKLGSVLKVVKKVNPDVLRSYNPLMQGWLAVKASKESGIPCIVSIHNNYDRDNRDLYLKSKKYAKYLKFWYSAKTIEPYTIKNATKIICAYRFLVPYAKRFGAKDIDVIYNRIDLTRFSPDGDAEFCFDVPTIIYVARLSPEKNQECLIKAIKDLDVKLLLVGDGQCYDQLVSLAEDLGIKQKIEFIRSVPNEELARYYRSADLFAAPIKQGGVSIPMLEAMACGVPVLATERQDSQREDPDSAISFTKNTPEDFRRAILELTSNKDKLAQMRKGALKVCQKMSGIVMEEKEADVYKKVLSKGQ